MLNMFCFLDSTSTLWGLGNVELVFFRGGWITVCICLFTKVFVEILEMMLCDQISIFRVNSLYASLEYCGPLSLITSMGMPYSMNTYSFALMTM